MQATPLSDAGDCISHYVSKPEDVEFLVSISQNAINIKNGRGETPLHRAFQNKKFNVAAKLLEHGADFTAKDASGRTPLQTLLRKPDVDDSSVQQLATTLKRVNNPDLKRILDRYQQMAGLPFAQTGLASLEMLKIAYFTEMELPRLADATTRYFKKSQYGLARSIAVGDSGELLLLSKRKVSILDTSGTFKRVTSAVCLPLLQNAKTASLSAQSVSKDEATLEDVEEGRREMQIHYELKDSPGIWPIHAWFEYTKTTKSGEKIKKISAITAFGAGDLTELRKVAYPELKTMALGLIQGLHSMHQKGYVHADLKLSNALRRADGTTGLIDFGFTFKAGHEKPTFIYEDGYYGSIFCTPPEVFGNLKFSGDFFKTDVWALGVMLYELRFGVWPSWANIPMEYFDDGSFHPITPAAREEFARKIGDDIEVRFAKLNKMAVRTPEESLDLLIFKMLRLNPKDRIDMATALAEIGKM